MTLTKEDLSAIAGLLQPLQDDIAGLKSGFSDLKDDITILKSDVSDLKNDITDLKSDMDTLKGRITSLEVHLENTTDRNILIIAEGHLDLSRKLDQALTLENEKELFFIRVNLLEREVRKLKEQVQR
ncbi:MAG: hypothetical protein HFG78_01630 [Hungatella sp.]|nr:hypothetical protein [Hungatella sp.]